MIYSIINCPECGCEEVICFNDDICEYQGYGFV
jgi:hypothetical protein